MSLYDALLKIREMPYFKNEAHKSGEANFGHEAAIVKVLESCNLKLYKRESNLAKELLEHWADTGDDTEIRKKLSYLPVGGFITQPRGTQAFPDVIVRNVDDRFFPLEAKSVKGGCPMWNDSFPLQDAIYIITSGNYNQTTFARGKDIITLEMGDALSNIIIDVRNYVNERVSGIHELDVYNRGWSLYGRLQMTQRGKGLIDYFKHKDRKYCEESALDYVKGVEVVSDYLLGQYSCFSRYGRKHIRCVYH